MVWNCSARYPSILICRIPDISSTPSILLHSRFRFRPCFRLRFRLRPCLHSHSSPRSRPHSCPHPCSRPVPVPSTVLFSALITDHVRPSPPPYPAPPLPPTRKTALVQASRLANGGVGCLEASLPTCVKLCHVRHVNDHCTTKIMCIMMPYLHELSEEKTKTKTGRVIKRSVLIHS